MADCRRARSAAAGCAPALEFLARFRSRRLDSEDRAALRDFPRDETLEHRLLASLLRPLFGDVLPPCAAVAAVLEHAEMIEVFARRNVAQRIRRTELRKPCLNRTVVSVGGHRH